MAVAHAPILPRLLYMEVQPMPIRDWKAALTRFTIQFGDRISIN